MENSISPAIMTLADLALPEDAEAQALALAERLRPLLAGQHPAVAGAALAQLVAIHVAGHRMPRAVQREILSLFRAAAWALVPVVEAELGFARVPEPDDAPDTSTVPFNP